MDLEGFLRTRRSVRRFAETPVPTELALRLIETATFVPSAHNRQPWRFAVVTQPPLKSELSKAMASGFRRDLEADGLPPSEVAARVEKSRTRIEAAPVVLIICMDRSDMDRYPDADRQEAERVMAIQSVSMAGLQLLLAAHAEGLAGVWNCAPLFAPDTVRVALSLPESWEPQGMLMIGFEAEHPLPRPRKAVQAITIIR